jgi:hypothetical protein
LLDKFTDYKAVTMSWNPTINTLKRVEIPKKTTQTSYVVKRGRIATTKRDNAPNKLPRKEKIRHPQKIVNVSQSVVYRHLVDNNIPQSSTQACYINENASTSENYDLVLENHETSTGTQEISINYTSSGEVYDSSTIIVNPCFSTILAENFLADPDSKTMTKCNSN